MVNPAEVATSQEPLSDEEVVARVLAGETAMFEIVMRRHNQRLYRVARAILRDDAESEDVMQDAYVRAFQHLDQFAVARLGSDANFRIGGRVGHDANSSRQNEMSNIMLHAKGIESNGCLGEIEELL